MQVFAIDPGNKESAYVLLDIEPYFNRPGCAYNPYTLIVKDHGKKQNANVLEELERWLNFSLYKDVHVVIERVQAMGMPVGYEVFETCEWIGRFANCSENKGFCPNYVYRLEEKITLCNDSKAKDTNIRQALIDRFAKHDLKNGKGTKQKPDVFYGFSKDQWAAMAVATTFLEQMAGTGHKATWRR